MRGNVPQSDQSVQFVSSWLKWRMEAAGSVPCAAVKQGKFAADVAMSTTVPKSTRNSTGARTNSIANLTRSWSTISLAGNQQL